jgi:hypothetical protein
MGAGSSTDARLAPAAVRFGAHGDGGLVAVALCRARVADGGAEPVVVTVTREYVDLYNALTGEAPTDRAGGGGGPPARPCRRGAPPRLNRRSPPPAPTPATPRPVSSAGDRKKRLKRPHLNTCADVRADTVFGFLVAVGTDRGDVVLFDAATLG